MKRSRTEGVRLQNQQCRRYFDGLPRIEEQRSDSWQRVFNLYTFLSPFCRFCPQIRLLHRLFWMSSGPWPGLFMLSGKMCGKHNSQEQLGMLREPFAESLGRAPLESDMARRAQGPAGRRCARDRGHTEAGDLPESASELQKASKSLEIRGWKRRSSTFLEPKKGFQGRG